MVEESKHHEVVANYINNLLTDNDQLFINDFVVIEMFHLLIKQRGPDIGKRYVNLLLDTNLIIKLPTHYNKSYFLKIWTELVSYGTKTTIGGRDSSIITSMKTHSLENIISNDRGFDKVDGITLFNPLVTS